MKVEMQRHEFLFGGGIFDVVPYASGEMKDPLNREAFEQKFEKWNALMNNATLPFYWGGFEPEEGKPRNEQVMAGRQVLKGTWRYLKGPPALLAYELRRLAHEIFERRDSSQADRANPS